MNLDSFGAIIKSALVAGLVAGLFVAAVQFVWTEPVVDSAITLEEQRHAAENAHAAAAAAPAAEAPPVVDRPTQKKGLFLGYTIYGLAWGLLFGAAYTLAQPFLPVNGRLGRGLLLAASAFWAVALLPFLKYPANPPGVGDPDTIDFRQHVYLGMLVGGVVVAALALTTYRKISSARGSGLGAVVGLGMAAAGSVALFVGLPQNPDVVRMPMALVMEFRVHSVVGLGLFWLVLGAVFGPVLGWLVGGEARQAGILSRSASV